MPDVGHWCVSTSGCAASCGVKLWVWGGNRQQMRPPAASALRGMALIMDVGPGPGFPEPRLRSQSSSFIREHISSCDGPRF